MEEKIVDYIIEDFSDIIKDGLSNNIDDFPMTKVLGKYLTTNSLSTNIISGIMYDILMSEYIEYITK